MKIEIVLPENLSRFGFDNVNQFKPLEPDVIDKVRWWIREHSGFKKLKNINPQSPGSYGLKHVAEDYLKIYVAMGNFIAAMILEGYDYKRDKRTPVNCNFNLGFIRNRRGQRVWGTVNADMDFVRVF